MSKTGTKMLDLDKNQIDDYEEHGKSWVNNMLEKMKRISKIPIRKRPVNIGNPFSPEWVELEPIKNPKIKWYEWIQFYYLKYKPIIKATFETTIKVAPMPVWLKVVLESINQFTKSKGLVMKDAKNTISNWVGIVVLVGGAVQTYLGTLDGSPINWVNLGMAVAVAVIAYFTGKTKDIKAK